MRLRSLFLFAAFLLAVAPAAQGQPAFLVADVNPAVPQVPFPDYYVRELATLGNVFYVTADDGEYGAEIWRTDGTPSGTRLLKDLCPGSCSSNPYSLTVSNGLLFFVADDGYHGVKLWKSDGTPEGTVRVADISPAGPFIDAGGVLFIPAQDDAHGLELWTSDGTEAGTRLIKDIIPGTGGIQGRFLATSGQRLLFTVDDGAHGFEPWVSDGTEAGTLMVADVRPGSSSSINIAYPETLHVKWDAAPAPSGGFLFAADDGTGTSLWRTDGTPGGTVHLSSASSPRRMTTFQGAVYFAAADAAAGVELWKSDGTAAGTARVRDILAGTGDSDPWDLTVAGNHLYFRAADGVHGRELWKSDGTAAGTTLVADLNPGPGDAFLSGVNSFYPDRYGFSALGNDLVFFAYDQGGLQLWRTDGLAATKLTTAGFSSSILQYENATLTLNGRLYFMARGTEIWSSDGTAAGTRQLADLVTATSSIKLFSGKTLPNGFGSLGNLLFFGATNGASGHELWRTDGTAAGTFRTVSLGAPPYGSQPHQIHPLGSRVVFAANADLWASDGIGDTRQLGTGSPFGSFPVLGGSLFYAAFETVNNDVRQRLWKTDGTPQGTVPVSYLSTFIDAGNMVVSGGRIFVPGFENGAGYSLWVTDGTAPGTVHLSGLVQGQDFSQIGRLVDRGGTVFFAAYEVGQGWGLWKSDGTAAGTVLIKSFRPLASGFLLFGEAAAPAGGPLFLAMGEPEAGVELWKSDGTTAGTVRVADIAPGSRGSNPRVLTPAGGKLYFVADDGVHGSEVWVSDGTEAGTHLAADILPGPDSSRPDNLAAVGDTLLFSAFDGVHGVEPWRTGGTLIGTRRVQDIAPGSLSSSPTGFTVAGPNVYFAATDNTTGFELWAVSKASVLSSFGDVSTTHWAWRSVEAAAAAGITLGCDEGLFCPDRVLNRAEMGVFLGRGLHGSTFVPPPATGTRFTDVPASYWAADWIEQIADDGVTQGCAVSPSRYCPEAQVARAEMAIFLLRARHGGGYVPPPATGTRFADVPASHWAAAWIEQLAAEGITNGCDVDLYCPNKTVGRAEMAVFLARAFDLLLP